MTSAIFLRGALTPVAGLWLPNFHQVADKDYFNIEERWVVRLNEAG